MEESGRPSARRRTRISFTWKPPMLSPRRSPPPTTANSQPATAAGTGLPHHSHSLPLDLACKKSGCHRSNLGSDVPAKETAHVITKRPTCSYSSPRRNTPDSSSDGKTEGGQSSRTRRRKLSEVRTRDNDGKRPDRSRCHGL